MKKKKLVSYCLFCYNQENYIEESVRAALDQSYSNLEIIISDDASTDTTFSIIESIINEYEGPHTIILNQNEKNLGIGGHVSHICKFIASGEYVITAAGDDISKSYHVQRGVDLMNDQDIYMIDFNGDVINHESKVIGQRKLNFKKKTYTIDDYLQVNSIQSFAPGRIIKKEVFEKFELISSNCPTEDSVTVLRSLLLGGFLRVNETLVYYRKHDLNISGAHNIGKLSNMRIMAQYYRDILHFYDNNSISDMKCKLLLDRIHLELDLRNQRYGNKNKLLSRVSTLLLGFKIRKFKKKLKLAK
ncbi:glycosyltransferase [Aureibaculum luteum]|uniref:glycosyltransferase n=1 Tax=Aureibaculum luteum TaxID=1548456 RepID=UPI000E53EC0A|nr:glycosyltransferase [Aureibaculum luteum]